MILGAGVDVSRNWESEREEEFAFENLEIVFFDPVGVGMDGTALAAPVEVGPELEVQKEKGEGVGWSTSDDFVFAYRVSRLKVKGKTGEVREEEHTKEGLYGLPEDEEKESGEIFNIEKLEGDEAVAGEFGDEGLANVEDEDEDECVCVLPQ
ncbi:hypothetical protein K469DRAFT_751064 [Zopfia rhizophila CBS 207.26]|uniref:Uncharacterized protein n=1 Tax=Zopfia rhizophila CBS 207.26 TaxID=1314779 RepID=A0A6A6E2X7_9PEZI|nr:hypothetical protein K469DRAFT_751064 [Zopfia rhizophila CBS 207.26]